MAGWWNGGPVGGSVPADKWGNQQRRNPFGDPEWGSPIPGGNPFGTPAWNPAIPRPRPNRPRPRPRPQPSVAPGPSQSDVQGWVNNALAGERRAMQQEQRRWRQEQRRQENQARQSAYDAFSQVWKNYGLDGGQIMAALKGLPGAAYRQPELMAEAIRGTQTWADRFGAVTKAREKNGLTYWDEGQILAAEGEFQDALSPFSDRMGQKRRDKYIQNWIGNGVSMNEIRDRVDLAQQWLAGQEKNTLKWFRENYGIRNKDILTYVLDTDGKRGPEYFVELQQQLTEAQIGGQALTQGIDLNKGITQKLADRIDSQALSRTQVNAAITEAAGERDTLANLAAVYGQKQMSGQQIVASNLGMNVKQTKREEALRSREQSTWKRGYGGSGAGAFSQSRSGRG